MARNSVSTPVHGQRSAVSVGSLRRVLSIVYCCLASVATTADSCSVDSDCNDSRFCEDQKCSCESSEWPWHWLNQMSEEDCETPTAGSAWALFVRSFLVLAYAVPAGYATTTIVKMVRHVHTLGPGVRVNRSAMSTLIGLVQRAATHSHNSTLRTTAAVIRHKTAAVPSCLRAYITLLRL